jgi:CRP/FNR family transcriptional regulator, cyclic AMP receptor protein
MSSDRRPPELASHPFMARLTPGQLERLLPCASEVNYPDGAFVFREGEGADALYLIRSGCVTLEQHVPGRGAVQVESLCAGDILGLSWLFPTGSWMLDARCIEPVEAIVLQADCLRQRMQEDAGLAVVLLTHMVQALYQRLVRVRLQRLDVYGPAE